MSPSVPQYSQPADDPAYTALKAQAEQDKLAALQDRAGIDSAGLMARYGTRLAMAGAGASAAGASPTLAAPAAGTGATGMQNLLSTITSRVA